MNAREAAATYLYRHFDAAGVLLYVGISLSAVVRLSNHRTASSWSEQIATVTVEQFPTRGEAYEAETIAIRTEKPLYNKAKKGAKRVRGKSVKLSMKPKSSLQELFESHGIKPRLTHHYE